MQAHASAMMADHTMASVQAGMGGGSRFTR